MLNSPTPPKYLYFVSVYFPNGLVRTPNLFVCSKLEESFHFASSVLAEFNKKFIKLRARKIEFIETKAVTSDFFHQGRLQEYSPSRNQKMINLAEQDFNHSLISIIDKTFDGKSYYFLDHYLNCESCNKFIELLKMSNKPLFIPVKRIHIYKPTNEIYWSYVN